MKFGKPNTMAKKTATPNVNANAVVNAAASFLGEYAAMKFNMTSDAKTVMEMANRFMIAIKTSAEARIAELTGSIKPAAPVAETTKTAPAPAKSKKEAPTAKATAPAKAATKAKKVATPTTTTEDEDIIISISDKKAVKKLGLHFIPYSEKCTIIAGDTKPIRKGLSTMAKLGVFPCSHLKAVNGFEGGFAWLVNNKHIAEVGKTLGIKVAK